MGNSRDSFDLDAYAGKYGHFGAIKRLEFVVWKQPDLASEALKLLIKEVKNGKNTELYQELFKLAEGKLDGEIKFDRAWVTQVDIAAEMKLSKLKCELENHRTKSLKESAYISLTALADFYLERGNTESAMQNYSRSRGYCANPAHYAQMFFNVIRTRIHERNFTDVLLHVISARESTEIQGPELESKLECCAGLAYMCQGSYRFAAQAFVKAKLSIVADLQKDLIDTVAADDIAIYGGICSLATFNRKELKESVIENASFFEFLDLVPEVREMILDFHNSDYKSCLSYFERIRPDLRLDMYLSGCLHQLYESIRAKALVQYCSPFSVVDLNVMAAAFETKVEEFTEEIVQLITDDKIPARIDTVKRTLNRRKDETINATFANAVIQGEAVFAEAEARLLGMQMRVHRMYV
eukprot:Plantae.Rhodophyta-Purpureofilum_apyrenoidigerum.ctg29018.p1 GENE.Plantae.Rhodophyta-Purpureofilum_apyrenoidigerum.ctg29018~~Plantae.Rhodophyta-Purpureofilum_apyrenoidigerum.ctg29018.p1  ORF type:complete len:411 (-),score=90.42 Plantae.Rhodophyta-Purpureofilum_apyrenoidigerum.ctg29018:275-1507(-)